MFISESERTLKLTWKNYNNEYYTYILSDLNKTFILLPKYKIYSPTSKDLKLLEMGSKHRYNYVFHGRVTLFFANNFLT